MTISFIFSQFDFPPYPVGISDSPHEFPMESALDSAMEPGPKCFKQRNVDALVPFAYRSQEQQHQQQQEQEANPIINSDVIDELVEESGRILDEMLKKLNILIESEVNLARKASLANIRVDALKERTNFRLLSRHIAHFAANSGNSGNSAANSTPNSGYSTANSGNYTTTVSSSQNGVISELTTDFRKDFENLPEKLFGKFACDLPVSD